jgi:uncharacterized protein (TIGR02186 family)
MTRLLLLFVMIVGSFSVHAETLVASLSSHRVAIASNYTGTDVVVFGSVERDAQTVSRVGSYHLVITVRGPQRSIVVREKERLGPIWINREQQKFAKIPSFLAILSSYPLDQITTDALRRRLRIGIDAVLDVPELTRDRGADDKPFREALVRLKAQEGLYFEKPSGVTFLTPNIFRASIPFPATAPTGEYEVEMMLFADSVNITREVTHFEVVKIGFEQRIAALARDKSFIYGLITALTALFFGWIGNLIFRKD